MRSMSTKGERRAEERGEQPNFEAGAAKINLNLSIEESGAVFLFVTLSVTAFECAFDGVRLNSAERLWLFTLLGKHCGPFGLIGKRRLFFVRLFPKIHLLYSELKMCHLYWEKV